MEPVQNLKRGERATVVSAGVSVTLLIIKGIAGLLTGSVVLVTSALDSLADIMGMSASWFGFRVSQKQPKGKFPYGYFKAESIATLFVSFLILYAACRLLIEGYNRLFVPPAISMPAIALSISFVSVFISFGLSRFLLREGRKINSELLLTNSRERLGDVAATVAVFVAVAMSYFNVLYAEGIVTIIISVLILRLGVISVKGAVFALMDIGAGHEKGMEVKNIIRKTAGVEESSSIKLRKAGPFVFGEATIRIRGHTHVDRAHRIADEIEQKIKRRMSEVVEFTIHVEPYKGKRLRIAIPVEDDNGLHSRPAKKLTEANHILFVDVDKGTISKISIRSNPGIEKTKKARLQALDMIVKQGADVLTARKIGEISFHTLRDHMVDIYRTEGKTAREVVERYIDGRLKILVDHVR